MFIILCSIDVITTASFTHCFLFVTSPLLLLSSHDAAKILHPILFIHSGFNPDDYCQQTIPDNANKEKPDKDNVVHDVVSRMVSPCPSPLPVITHAATAAKNSNATTATGMHSMILYRFKRIYKYNYFFRQKFEDGTFCFLILSSPL